MKQKNPDGEEGQKPAESQPVFPEAIPPTPEKIAGVRAQIEAEIARRKKAQKMPRESSPQHGQIPDEPDRDGGMIVPEAASLQSIQKLGEHADKVIERVCDPSSGKTYIRLSARTGKKDALIREAEAYKKLHGAPGILKVVSMNLEADEPHILLEDMELCPALDASELRTLTLDKRVDLAGKILTVMTAMHRRGLLHRDLKPDHFMIGNDGELYVIDFSMSVETNASTTSVVEPSIPSLAEGRQLHGKEYHQLAALRITPEEISGKPYSKQAEIFVLGNFLALAIAGKIVQTEAELNEVVSDETSDLDTLKKIKKVIHRMRERNADGRYKKLEDAEKDWAEALGELPVQCINRVNFDFKKNEKALANAVLERLLGPDGNWRTFPEQEIMDKIEGLLLRPGNTPEIWRDVWIEYFLQRTSLTPGRENAEMGILMVLIGLEFELPIAGDQFGHIRKLLIDNLKYIEEIHIMRLGIRERMICVRDLEDKDLSAKSGRSMTVPRAFVNTDAMEIFFDVIADDRMNKDHPKVKAAFREIYGVMQALSNIKVPLKTDMESCMMGFERALAQHAWTDAELNDLFPISDSITERNYLRSALAKCLPPARLAKLASDGVLPLSAILKLVPEIVWRDGDPKVRRDFITAVQKIPGVWEANGQAMAREARTAFDECWGKARERAEDKICSVAAAEEDITEAVNVLRECCRFGDSASYTRRFETELSKLINLYPDQLAKWAIAQPEANPQVIIAESIEQAVLRAGGKLSWKSWKPWTPLTLDLQYSFFSGRYGAALKAIASELDRRMQQREQAHVKIPRDHVRQINTREMRDDGKILEGLLCLVRMVKKERENAPEPNNENLLAVEGIVKKNRAL